jgi:hypothetical protein
MTRRDPNHIIDPDAVEDQDPMGEQTFAERGFEDAPGGGPDLSAAGLEDNAVLKTPGRKGQKIAGVPESAQKEPNTASLQRPDSEGVVIRERGGESKGDPAVGGTRPD